MTKSIYEKIQLTSEHNEVIDYVTSDEYIEKVLLSKSLRNKRTPSIRKKKLTQNFKKAIAHL